MTITKILPALSFNTAETVAKKQHKILNWENRSYKSINGNYKMKLDYRNTKIKT